MIEKREITYDEYDALTNSVDSYDAITHYAEELSRNSIWPAHKYGVYGADVSIENGKYYISWAHKNNSKQVTAYEKVRMAAL